MPSWKEYERFLINDGWTFVESRSGRDRHYVKIIDGVQRITRVSKSSGEISPALFAKILKQQAFASEAYFNRVKKRKPKADWQRMM